MEHRLNILIEDKVPFLKGVFEPLATVRYAPPEEITPELVSDADAIIVRTRTRCDAALLGGSRCSFVATATIGTDHIDLPWCASRGIAVGNAPGCNAPAVAQYVFGSIAAIDPALLSAGTTIGIVGVGHVGSIVARWAESLGMRALLCDPPKFRAGDSRCGATMADIAAQADIVTFHTPLTTSGPDCTRHLAGDAWLASLQRRPLLINAARGAVVDNAALSAAIDAGLVRDAAIDCWEGEPAISAGLLARAAVATPHIAGYSREGKWRASRMVADALCTHFGLPPVVLPGQTPGQTPAAVTAEAVAASYNPLHADTPALKKAPGDFEKLRNGYALRAEL